VSLAHVFEGESLPFKDLSQMLKDEPLCSKDLPQLFEYHHTALQYRLTVL
jgi:hypothetical protein